MEHCNDGSSLDSHKGKNHAKPLLNIVGSNIRNVGIKILDDSHLAIVFNTRNARISNLPQPSTTAIKSPAIYLLVNLCIERGGSQNVVIVPEEIFRRANIAVIDPHISFFGNLNGDIESFIEAISTYFHWNK
jgi:hypothetical protein